MQRANRIKELREQRRWTQTTLGAKIGASKETIYKIEHGVQRITESQAHALAAVFGVRIDDLYEAESERGLGRGEAMPFAPDASTLESCVPLDEGHRWYQLNKSHLDQIAYRDGDRVIVSISHEELKNIKTGSVVLAAKSGDSSRTIMRQFIPIIANYELASQ